MVTGYAPIHCKKIVYHREPAFMNRVRPALKTSDRIPEHEQCYYKALQVFHQEAIVAAKERRRMYGIPDDAVGKPAPAYEGQSKQEEKVKKKLFGQLTPADIIDDDEDAKLHGLKDIFDM
jgi:type IV secretory pathway TraG/TraD family ATPase VirD4